jgi:ATP-dependent DNA helicase RecG
MMPSAAELLGQFGTASQKPLVAAVLQALNKDVGSRSQPAELVAGQTACNPGLATFSPVLATFQWRVSTEALRDCIRRLCQWASQSCDQLATLLGKDRDYLRNKHLTPIVRDGQLRFRYPESAKHPHQAYVAQEDKSND